MEGQKDGLTAGGLGSVMKTWHSEKILISLFSSYHIVQRTVRLTKHLITLWCYQKSSGLLEEGYLNV